MPNHPAAPLRIYLSAVPGDADAEREALARRLPALGSDLGIELRLIDPLAGSAPDGESWDLPRRFEAIASCDVFLGLVVPGDEISESEIRFVLDSPEPSGPRWPKSFFYLRSPQELKPDNASLRDLLRASSRPVFEGYGEPEAFVDRVLADLRAELSKPLPPDILEGSFSVSGAAEPSLQPTEKPLPLHEDVRFSVYRPRVVAPLEWYPLVVFAHLDEMSNELSDEDREAIREIENQAREAFAEVPQGFSGESEDSSLAIPDEAEITFVPEIPGVRFNPPRATFLWLEPLHREDFRLQASAALDGKTARGRLSVFWGKILLAEMNLKILVDRQAAAVSVEARESPGEREDARPYQNIFASYSHRDTPIVEEFERYIRTLGNRYLIDRETLRAGEVWDDRLQGMIREADVFQLFWSRNAMQSPFVEKEWRYALSLGRDNFIRPTYWEDPLPELPERGLPPQELKRLHFHRFAGGPQPAAARAAPKSAPASPPEIFDPPPRRGRKLLWATSAAAALLLVCLFLPTMYMAREAAPVRAVTAGPVEIVMATGLAPGKLVTATFPVEGLPEGKSVTVRWIGPDGATVAEEPRIVPPEAHPTFELTSDLAPGDYQAEVWIDGRRVAEQPFTVNR